MKFHQLFTILLFLYLKGAYGQRVDTIYYDKNWNPSTINDYKYYRLARQDKNNVKVFDYFKSGMLQMSGAYKSFDFSEKTGPFYYYKKDRVDQIEIYEPSKYPEIVSKFRGVLENIPTQPDSLKICIFFHKNNVVKSIGYISECCFYSGPWFTFSKTGEPIYMFTYLNDKFNGPYHMYIDSNIWISGFYKDGKRDGRWEYYTFDGALKRTVYYEKGKIIR